MTSASAIEKCCLIANPVAANPTHYLVEHAFAENDLDWRFMTFEVDPDRLGDAMRGIRALGFHGVKIGEPFQEAVLKHVDELTERARRCGSINTLTADGERLVGDNTEGAALADLLRRHVKLAGRRMMVVGAGRLARAIALALAEAGAAEIVVASRSAPAGQQLVESIQRGTSAAAALVLLNRQPLVLEPTMAALVNATSLGMNDPSAKLPLDAESLRSDLVVADVAYNSAHTWLTRIASERGGPVVDGVELLVAQTALALEAWTGVKPDTTTMREAAEEFLGI